MNKQQSTQMASLRKKLIAAIAMLLVACIMTVSSTYAWFTLSTAPEVKGISTTIGANGNLEMALGTYDTFYGSGDPGSNVKDSYDSTENWLDSNITWGNLVDLSEGYGLDLIKLYPTRLNVNSATQINKNSPLKFPTYGADGRISALLDTTQKGKVNGNAFETVPGGHAGVSAIGNVSALTPRQNQVLKYKSAVGVERDAAKASARAAINKAGILASIMMGDMAITEDHINNIKALIASLEESTKHLSESMKSAILAYLGGVRNGNETDSPAVLDDIVWDAVVSQAADKDIVDFLAWLEAPITGEGEGQTTLDLPDFTIDGLDTYVEQYEAVKDEIATAKGLVEALGGSPSVAEVKTAVNSLIDSNDMTLNGYDLGLVQSSEDMQMTLIQAMLPGGEGLTLEFVYEYEQEVDDDSNPDTAAVTQIVPNENMSVFNDIAVLTGAYNTSMKFPEGTLLKGYDLGTLLKDGLNVKVLAKDSGSLTVLSAAAEAFPDAPGADTTQAQALSDVYGYVVDLLFRTNAADSYLQLQTTGVGRIYGENGTEDTQGSGSNMIFTLDPNLYTADQIKNLAESIRVVFYDVDGNILGVAVLDTVNAEHNEAAGTLKADLKLAKWSISYAGDDNDGKIVIGDGDGQFDPTKDLMENNSATSQDDRIALKQLNSNEKFGLSALVYLDGDEVTNADAVLSELKAMMNLQFSSSAELTPMDYSDLQQQGQAGETPAPDAGGDEEPVEP